MKHDTREAEDVLDVAVAIAEADGEIEPDLAQAVINAAYLVACADGECEAS